MICEKCGHVNPEPDHPYYEHAVGPLTDVYKNAGAARQPVECGSCLYYQAMATHIERDKGAWNVVEYTDPSGFTHKHGYVKRDGR